MSWRTLVFTMVVVACPRPAAATPDVDIVVVSPAPRDDLRGELTAALTHEPLVVHWQSQPTLDASDFRKSSAAAPDEPARPKVWMDVRSAGAVILYFRDASAVRFHVRRVPRHERTAITAEHVAQILAPTFEALADLEQPALDVAEVTRALTPAAPEPPAPAAVTAGAPLPRRGSQPAPRIRPARLGLEIDYAFRAAASAGGAAHGPELRLASPGGSRPGDVTLWASLFHPLAFSGPEEGGTQTWDVELWDVRAGLGLSVWRYGALNLLFTAAGGAAWMRGQPREPSVAPAGAASGFTLRPALRGEARAEVAISPWLSGTLGLSLDVMPETLLFYSSSDGRPSAFRVRAGQPGGWVGLAIGWP